MNIKNLEIKDELTTAKVFINDNEMIAIALWEEEDLVGVIQLDKDDTIELIKELKKLLKQL